MISFKAVSRIASLNPYGSVRDVLVFFLFYAPILLVAQALQYFHVLSRGEANATAAGSFFGMLFMMIVVLPVKFRMPVAKKSAILKRIDELRYREAASDTEWRFFVPQLPWYRKWDSNRISLRETADGFIDVYCPLGISHRLDLDRGR